MSPKKSENLTKSRFVDTIKRTLLIMVIAVIFTRLLDFPLWMTVLAVLLGVPVIIHAIIWIRRLENSDKKK